jgi:hypothetical protein
MPLVLVALLFPLLIILLVSVVIPLSIVQRFRVGIARRRARRWLATLNIVGIGASSLFFLIATAITSAWEPLALRYALIGFAVGGVLGILGLLLTRWELAPDSLYYTPNRWLVLAITAAVSARILYGFWRGWQSWQGFDADDWWVAPAGIAESLAAGALVLGYYLVFWAGVRWRITRTPTLGFHSRT